MAGIVEGIGDERLAGTTLVAGAVVAAVLERVPPTPLQLLALELDTHADPAETLARSLRAEDLWDVLESAQLDRELVELDEKLGGEAFHEAVDGAIADFARTYWSDWHAERLAELVARTRALFHTTATRAPPPRSRPRATPATVTPRCASGSPPSFSSARSLGSARRTQRPGRSPTPPEP